MRWIDTGLKVFELFSFCAGLSFICFAQTPTFSPSGKMVAWQGRSTSMPTWSGGSFVTLDQPLPPPALEAPSSLFPTLYVSGDQGNTVTPIRIPDAVWMQNRGVARGNDGTLAVCGQAKDAAGQFWSYLAIFPPKGQAPIVVHTDPYAATAVTIAPDGTVWTKGVDWVKVDAAGMDKPSQYRYAKKDPNGILRHFSRTGSFLGSVIPQSGFRDREVSGDSRIASSADRIGWCQYTIGGSTPSASDGSYFEVTADGVVSKTPLPTFNEGESIDSLAITDGGIVLITKSVKGANFQLFALDRKSGLWQKAHFPGVGFEGTGYYVLGSTGNTVAFWTHGTAGLTAQLVSVQ
jgi:hypothetical protein